MGSIFSSSWIILILGNDPSKPDPFDLLILLLLLLELLLLLLLLLLDELESLDFNSTDFYFKTSFFFFKSLFYWNSIWNLSRFCSDSFFFFNLLSSLFNPSFLSLYSLSEPFLSSQILKSPLDEDAFLSTASDCL